MEYNTHGGYCCGIGHISGFDNASITQFDEAFAEHERAAGGRNRVCEVVLSQRQVDGDRWRADVQEQGGWPAILARKGFLLVGAFTNSNTGRNCYIFHHCPIWNSTTARPWWNGDTARTANGRFAPARAATAITEVSQEYYANLRDSGRRGPFTTEQEARNAYPRCRNFERRSIHSDGTSRWTPVV